MGENGGHDWMDAYFGQPLLGCDLIWACYSHMELLFDLWSLLAEGLGHCED